MKQIRRRDGHIVWLVTITLCATILRLAHELACRPSPGLPRSSGPVGMLV